jgi:ADP-ribose pyrophosphatase
MVVEQFSIPGVSGIIERCIDGVDHILIQERFKEDAPAENGLIEIPAGKIRRYEHSRGRTLNRQQRNPKP